MQEVNMKSDIAKISRLYESTYSDFISNGFKEKDSFYLLKERGENLKHQF